MSDVHRSLPFDEREYATRIQDLRDRMADRGIDLLVIFSPENVSYLTGYETIGYSSFQALLVPSAGEPALCIREMERTVAGITTHLDDFVTYGDTVDPVEQLRAALDERGWLNGCVAVEQTASFVPFATLMRLRERIGTTTDGSGLVEQGRRIKSPAEITAIVEACRMTEAGIRAALDEVRPGVSENTVAAAGYQAMMEAGSTFFAADPIVTSGWRSGVAHMTFGNRVMEAGDTILLEFGASRHRYFGPLMRSAVLPPVGHEVGAVADTILAALDAAIAAIRPGVTSAEVDDACRSVIEAAGHEPHFRKRTGYSVGLAYAPDWGEGHIVSLRRDDRTTLEPGMVFHIPPALRIPRSFGLGFSETVLVTDDGCELLTRFPRELFIGGQ